MDRSRRRGPGARARTAARVAAERAADCVASWRADGEHGLHVHRLRYPRGAPSPAHVAAQASGQNGFHKRKGLWSLRFTAHRTSGRPHPRRHTLAGPARSLSWSGTMRRHHQPAALGGQLVAAAGGRRRAEHSVALTAVVAPLFHYGRRRAPFVLSWPRAIFLFAAGCATRWAPSPSHRRR